jgi:uncharacterized protein YegP (UPF0339 family)
MKKEDRDMGKFMIRKSETGYVFHLVAANGMTIGTSQVYADMGGLQNGIDSVKKNCTIAPIEDQTEENFKEAKNPKYVIFSDKEGKTRFHLTASNGQIILASQAYKEYDSVRKGIDSVKINAPEAPSEMNQE